MTEAKLWKPGGFIADDGWRLAGEDDAIDSAEANAGLILPLDRYLELAEAQRQPDRFAVVLAPGDDIARLEPVLPCLALIALTFPAFSDGRAYSQASLLRSRYGFDGEIRATGDVLIDQVPLMLRCGIDTFAVTNPTALKRLAENRLPGINTHYQPATVPSRRVSTYSWRHAS